MPELWMLGWGKAAEKILWSSGTCLTGDSTLVGAVASLRVFPECGDGLWVCGRISSFQEMPVEEFRDKITVSASLYMLGS